MSKAKNNLLQRLIENVSAIVPENLGELRQEFKEELRTAVTKVLSECQIVTQEEFEAYTHALERTQKRVHALEQKLAELEAKK